MSDQPLPRPKIVGDKVKNPTKLELASDIAAALGIDPPRQSTGSSVDSTFLDRIHKALTGDDSTKTDAYRKAEQALQDVGLTYDPFWDTSEAAPTGGSTVTNRAYSRIRAAVTNVPRCFIFNVTDSDVGAKLETDHHRKYHYDSSVTGRGPLNDAGPGSRIIYYRTSTWKVHPKCFIAQAEVTYIGPGWTGPWEASISNYTEFERPVPEAELVLRGWNHPQVITEITFDTYKAILRAATTDWIEDFSAEERDPGGEVVAKRVIEEIPPPAVAPTLVVPTDLPDGIVSPAQVTTPIYTEAVPGAALVTSDLPRTPSNSARNKLAEKRASHLVRQALEAQGWTLMRDCQKDGVGYDLLYGNSHRELHVEVKGVISSTLAFNLTPKESWRVETDPNFVVVAVTNVLSPTEFDLKLLTRSELAVAPRVITGYRLKF